MACILCFFSVYLAFMWLLCGYDLGISLDSFCVLFGFHVRAILFFYDGYISVRVGFYACSMLGFIWVVCLV